MRNMNTQKRYVIVYNSLFVYILLAKIIDLYFNVAAKHCNLNQFASYNVLLVNNMSKTLIAL